MTPETKIKREIVAYLDTLEQCWHVSQHNVGYGRKGVPDRIVCYRGMFIAPEVKRGAAAAKASSAKQPWQQREIAAIRAAGGIAEVIWSVEQMQALIAEVDRRLDNPFAKVSNRRLFGL